MLNGEIIGTHFFKRTINGKIYLDFLKNHLLGYLEDIPLNVRQRSLFQQKGTSTHYTRVLRTFLNEQYPNRWVGRGVLIVWPPRSTDLNPLNIFYGGT